MKTFRFLLLATLVALFSTAVCCATAVAVVVIYQPICVSVGDVDIFDAKTGFVVMPIPYVCHTYKERPPYFAITQPNRLLTDKPGIEFPADSNLLSLAGVTIGTSEDDDTVTVHLEALQPLADLRADADDIAEATIECIRRMAQGARKRPILKITGKKDDEAKWLRWQEQFQKHDLTKPYNRPNA